ncbi:MAG: hypothetical protein L0241_10635, partial [Planctomycetia bacterium]|nr:hypothetical protein [Planctomycetia bacterium]
WAGAWSRLLNAFDTSAEYSLTDARTAASALAEVGALLNRLEEVREDMQHHTAAHRLQRLCDYKCWWDRGAPTAAALLLEAARGVRADDLARMLRHTDADPTLRVAFGWLEFYRDRLLSPPSKQHPAGFRETLETVPAVQGHVDDLHFCEQQLTGRPINSWTAPTAGELPNLTDVLTDRSDTLDVLMSNTLHTAVAAFIALVERFDREFNVPTITFTGSDPIPPRDCAEAQREEESRAEIVRVGAELVRQLIRIDQCDALAVDLREFLSAIEGGNYSPFRKSWGRLKATLQVAAEQPDAPTVPSLVELSQRRAGELVRQEAERDKRARMLEALAILDPLTAAQASYPPTDSRDLEALRRGDQQAIARTRLREIPPHSALPVLSADYIDTLVNRIVEVRTALDAAYGDDLPRPGAGCVPKPTPADAARWNHALRWLYDTDPEAIRVEAAELAVTPAGREELRELAAVLLNGVVWRMAQKLRCDLPPRSPESPTPEQWAEEKRKEAEWLESLRWHADPAADISDAPICENKEPTIVPAIPTATPASGREERMTPDGFPPIPDHFRNWLVACYLNNPVPEPLFEGDRPVVLVNFAPVAEYLLEKGMEVLPTLDACKQAAWIDDLYFDIHKSTDPNARLPARIAALNLPFGRHRFIAIRSEVLSAKPALTTPNTERGNRKGKESEPTQPINPTTWIRAMSDAEVASAFFDACFKAECAASNGRLPQPPNQYGPEDPCWRNLSAAFTPRLSELAVETEITFQQIDWGAIPPTELRVALEALCCVADALRQHFFNLAKDNPERHARDSFRRFLAEIPRLRDEGQRGFLHRVMGRFDANGAEDELRPCFESVAELAAVLGIERPRGWRPNPIPDWAAWHDEWARLSDFVSHVLNTAGKQPELVNVEQNREDKPRRDSNQPSTDRQNDIIATIQAAGTPLTRPELVKAMKLKTEGKLGHHLAWMVANGQLINIPNRGYWPTGQSVPA